jgi:hypothetical protein
LERRKAYWALFSRILSDKISSSCDHQGFLFENENVKGICLKDFDTINLLKHVKLPRNENENPYIC